MNSLSFTVITVYCNVDIEVPSMYLNNIYLLEQ